MAVLSVSTSTPWRQDLLASHNKGWIVLSYGTNHPFFTDRERVALDWAESVTLCAESGVPDEVYLEALNIFSEQELVALTYLIINMNGLNRIGVSFRMVPPTRPL